MTWRAGICAISMMFIFQPCLCGQSYTDLEKQRLSKKVESLIETHGNPLEHGGAEYFGISIDPKTGNVSHIYEDVKGRVEKGKMYKLNYLFNLEAVDVSSIEAYDDLRFWAVRLSVRDGKKISVHGIRWSSESQSNEDDWWGMSSIDPFCGVESEGKAREISDYLRSLVKLYQGTP